MAKRTTATKARGPLKGDEPKLLAAPPPDLTHAPAATDTGGGSGPANDVEHFYVWSAAAFAEVSGGLNVFTVASFMRETGEFQEARPGQGLDGCYLLRECFQLACWGELSRRMGVSLKAASRIAPRTLDLYGEMRGGRTQLALSLDPKRLGQPALFSGEPVFVTIDLWSIWQSFWPRFRAYVVKHDPNMRGACATFEARVKDLREALAAGLSPA
jgi:hypothetical protein